MFEQTHDKAQKSERAFFNFMQQLYFVRPGIITAFKPAANRVDAMIAVSKKRTGGIEVEYLPMPVIPDIPLCVPYDSGSGYALTFPITAGSRCLLLFSDAFIGNFIKTGEFSPNEVLAGDNSQTIPGTHSMKDAMCLPGLITDVDTITEWNTGAVELRNRDRTQFVSVSDQMVQMVSGNASHTLQNGTVTTVAPGGYYVQAPNWSTTDGGASVNGTVTAEDFIPTSGPTYKGHAHNGIEPGGGTSGGIV